MPLVQRIVRRAPQVLCGSIALMFASSAFGQAIVLDRGQSTYGSSYQHGFVRYHVSSEGKKDDIGHIKSNAVVSQASYGLTDRVTFDVDGTLSGAKYIGARPHGRLDDNTFHSTLQDFHVDVRANVLTRPLFVTPYMQLTVPSHHYQLEGHTATGKGKVELTSGLYAGRDLGPLIPSAYFEMMGSHTWVQRTTIDTTSERLNRTNVALIAGYYLTPSVAVSAVGTGVRTHGGWDFPRAFHNLNEKEEHDRLGKTKEVQAGGTLTYTFRSGLSIYAGYFTEVWARNTHAMAGPTFGFTWSPGFAPTWLAKSRTRPAMLLAQR